MISAVLFGAMAVGQVNSFAPNYAKAKLSAAHIMMLLNKEPAIDNLSKDGDCPVHDAKPRAPNTALEKWYFTTYLTLSFLPGPVWW